MAGGSMRPLARPSRPAIRILHSDMAKTAKLGDPALAETRVGPVTTPPQYQKILAYIDVAKNEGARCVLGGGPATKDEGGGKYFVKPTIFTGVDNKMRIAQEEVF